MDSSLKIAIGINTATDVIILTAEYEAKTTVIELPKEAAKHLALGIQGAIQHLESGGIGATIVVRTVQDGTNN